MSTNQVQRVIQLPSDPRDGINEIHTNTEKWKGGVDRLGTPRAGEQPCNAASTPPPKC